ncbi:hypothetical protein GUITHDRAFT_118268 [Guillardia theta CCMP2712]|uniref:Uncharacterized protein n=1 Tax=Guillardia theta (strain CCMP2712) TaxID=905079 RepID=L1IHI4_GUITC|nr:hypothetical protein GUITHDRAFT_118268 [Guillardia theta CCMP2712]EKX35562.1 hypothetical protein GUITHDRAFT_118268 [Guillardia theta CCMP2712]|eukprot:XP_005822542.1 hypothetical protein GUITHDRAFT_118268 [Guillardia theta CCMP2712]
MGASVELWRQDSSMVIDALDAGEARGMLTSNLMSMREPRIAINGENAVLQYVRSHQGKEPSKTRNQVFVIRCHEYGCFDNAG